MINTNGNRRPKPILVKKSITKEMVDDLRDFVKDINYYSFEWPDLIQQTGLSYEEANLILNTKKEKSGIVFTLVSSVHNNVCNVSIYVVEKKAISKIIRGFHCISDEVDIDVNYYFNTSIDKV